MQSTVMMRAQYGARAQLCSRLASGVPSFHAIVPYFRDRMFTLFDDSLFLD